MKPFVVYAALALARSLPAAATITIKDIEFKKESFSDATTLSILLNKTSIEVLKPQGGGTGVKPAAADKGWRRMLNLRMGILSGLMQSKFEHYQGQSVSDRFHLLVPSGGKN